MRKPVNFVIGSDDLMEINSVFIYEDWQIQVLKEINRPEFLESYNLSKSKFDYEQSFVNIDKGKIDLSTKKKYIENEPPNFKYYYSVKAIGKTKGN